MQELSTFDIETGKPRLQILQSQPGLVVIPDGSGVVHDVLLDADRHRVTGTDENDQPVYEEVEYVRSPDDAQREIVAERGRRFELGFDYDFGDERGVHHIGTTENDMKGWDDVTKMANALINVGSTDGELVIHTDTGIATITALEWQHILIAAGAWRQTIWTASFALQAMSPVPDDVTLDTLWGN